MSVVTPMVFIRIRTVGLRGNFHVLQRKWANLGSLPQTHSSSLCETLKEEVDGKISALIDKNMNDDLVQYYNVMDIGKSIRKMMSLNIPAE